jgi:hypothetical protein
VSLFGWALVFVGLGVAGLGVLALAVLRLWRGFKALGHDLSEATEALSRLGSTAAAPEAVRTEGRSSVPIW